MAQKTQTITVDGRDIAYTIKRYRRQKHVHMIVRGGALVVTAPPRCSQRFIAHALERHAQWIMQNVSAHVQKNVTIEPHVLAHLRAYTRTIITAKLAHFNAHYQLPYQRVTIRHQRTRWGSCSSRGTLSFNLRIGTLPEALQDYIVVHELCHVQEMNHSDAFWTLVAETIPDHKGRRRALKNYEL